VQTIFQRIPDRRDRSHESRLACAGLFVAWHQQSIWQTDWKCLQKAISATNVRQS